MTIAANKSVVRRYFEDVLDGGQVGLVVELFAPDCVVHRPELPEPLVGREQVTAYVSARPRTYSHSVTSFEHVIAEGDLVAVRLRHEVTYRADWRSRAGKIASSGKSITWTANRRSTCRGMQTRGRRCASRRWRGACSTAFRSGDARSFGPGTNARRV